MEALNKVLIYLIGRLIFFVEKLFFFNLNGKYEHDKFLITYILGNFNCNIEYCKIEKL